MPYSVSLNINKKLLILVLGVSLISITVITVLFFNFTDAILKEDIKNQLIGQSQERGKRIKLFFDTKIQQIKILATNSLILKSIVELNEITNEQDFNSKLYEKGIQLTVEIRNFQLREGLTVGLEDVQIFGKSGRVFFSLNEFQEKGKFTKDSKFFDNLIEPEVDFIRDNITDETKMIVVVPVFESKDNISEYIGIVIATTNTEALDRILLNRFELEKTVDVYLVNEDRLMISESMFDENVAFNQKVETLPVTECLENGKTFSGIYPDYRGVKILGTSHCYQSLGFVLLTEMDESNVLGPLFELQEKIIGIAVILMIGVSVVTYFISKRLSEPITKLSEAANKIAQGNFDVRTNIKSNDEIEQLSLSFDSMAKNLQESLIAINLREEIIKQQEDILLSFSEKYENSCVCIVDIVQSTSLTANLSDVQTQKFYEIFINSIATIVKKFKGIVVKNIGDALLFYFPKIDSSDKAAFTNVIECCLTICDSNEEINKQMIQEELPKIDYRVGVTYGTVNLAKVVTSSVDDIFGITVNRCAKINRFALPNNLIIGSDVYENIKSFSNYNLRNMNVKPMGINPIYSVYLVTRK